MNTTQAQQKALDDALVAPAGHLEFGKYNMRLKTNIKPQEARFQVVLDALALTPFYRAFLITADVPAIYMQEFWATVSFCPKIPGQKFKDLPLEHDILSFIGNLGHTRDITYLTDVNVDYLHQPWRAFATVINKCLSGKETGMDKIFLSHAKKTNKISYPRFTKIIIDYFISKDQSISRRNKMFWHTDRDDIMFTSMRCISRHEDTQVYGTILPKELINQALLESNAYKTYYAFASREKTSKPNSHASGSGDGVNTQSKVPDKQQQKTSCTYKGTDTIPGVPDVLIYESESAKESWGVSKDEDEDDENNSDDLSDKGDDDNDGNDGNDCDDDDANDDDKQEGDDTINDDKETDKDEKMDKDKDDEVTKELYKVSRFEQEEEDAHVTLTPVLDTQKTGADNEIASLMDTTAQHVIAILEITSSFTTTVPPPHPIFNPLQQEATLTHTPTTSETTTSLPALLDFDSIFKFNERVTNLEKDLSEMKQVDQYAQTLSSIPAIVDRYMDNKLGEAINKAIQAYNFDCKEEAQAKKGNVATLVIEKNVTESVEAAVLTRSSSQLMSTYEADASLFEFELTKIQIDKMEKNKSYDKAGYKKKLYDALVESNNTNKDLFDSYGEVFSLKRSRDEKDKDQDPPSKEKKSAHAEELSHTVKDSGMQQDQEFVTGDNDEQLVDKEVTKADWFKKPE
ncbi:hypothetical protein Tco_0500489 [Tanacetum coccineum]